MSSLSFGILRSKIWHSEDFRSMDTDSKLIFIYFLTNSARNVIGAYHLPLGHIEADTCYSRSEIIERVANMPGVTYAENVQWVVVENYLRNNPLNNKNYQISAERILMSLPEDIILIEAVLRATYKVRNLDPRVVKSLESRLKRLEEGKPLLPAKLLISGDDKGLVHPAKGLTYPVKGLVHPVKGLNILENDNKISKIMSAMGIKSPSSEQGAYTPCQGASHGDTGKSDVKSKPLDISDKGLVQGASQCQQNVTKTNVDSSSQMLMENGLDDECQGACKGLDTDQEVNGLCSCNERSEVCEGGCGPLQCARGMQGASHSQAVSTRTTIAKDMNRTQFKSLSGLHIRRESHLTEGAYTPCQGASHGPKREETSKTSQVIESEMKNDKKSKKQSENGECLNKVKPLARQFPVINQRVASEKSEKIKVNSDQLPPLEVALDTSNNSTSYIGEGVQGENLKQKSQPGVTGGDDAKRASSPDPDQDLSVLVQPALFEGLTEPGGSETDGLGGELIPNTSPRANTSKTIKTRSFPENHFVSKLCVLWNELVVPHGGRTMGPFNASFENKVKLRYQEAQKKPPSVARTITSIQDWAEFFHFIAHSDFLMGKTAPRDGGRPFRVDLGWVMRSTDNLWKIRRGDYHHPQTQRVIGAMKMPDFRNYDLDAFRA